MLRLKTFSVIIHIAGWLLFMALPLLFLNGRGNTSIFVLLASPYYWLFCATYIGLFYFNGYILFPKFFLTKKYALYAITCVCLYGCIYFLQPFDKLLRSTEIFKYRMAMLQMQKPYMPPPFDAPQDNGFNQAGPPPPNEDRQGFPPKNFKPGQGPQFKWPGEPLAHFDAMSLFLFLMITTLSTATKTVQQWQATEQRVISAEAEKASAELSFLKAQINPHFLFNTLNNIYTLAITNSGNTAESIMKLSNIMRYVTDDVTMDFVSLQSEVDCVEDYIDLQRLRLGSKTTVNFTIDGAVTRQKIAPLLLMTFVENVFKYGVSKQHESTIDISLKTDANTIKFVCTNPIFERKEQIERTGIGIANTKQRLQHLYPDKSILNITDDGKQFTVLLTLHT